MLRFAQHDTWHFRRSFDIRHSSFDIAAARSDPRAQEHLHAHLLDLVEHALDGTLDKAQFSVDPIFGFEVPKALPGVPSELLAPRYGAKDAPDYDRRAKDLAAKFVKNFEQYTSATAEIRDAGPHI